MKKHTGVDVATGVGSLDCGVCCASFGVTSFCFCCSAAAAAAASSPRLFASSAHTDRYIEKQQ